jgi:hypothetical protein
MTWLNEQTQKNRDERGRWTMIKKEIKIEFGWKLQKDAISQLINEHFTHDAIGKILT